MNLLRNANFRRMSILVLLLLPTTVFAVNGAFDYGFSAITRGMAGAGVALPQDSISPALNPAGLMEVKNRRDIGVAIYNPSFGYNANSIAGGGTQVVIAPGSHTSRMRFAVLPDFGASWVVNPRTVFGVSFHSIGGFGTTYKTSAQAILPNTPPIGPGVASTGVFGDGTVKDSLKQGIFSFTLARKLVKKVDVGLSLLVGVQTFEASGLSKLGSLSKYSNNISGMGTDYSIGGGVRVGALIHLLPKLVLGMGIQPKVYMTKLKRYKGLFYRGGQFDIPANGTIGLALHLRPNLVLAADVEEIWYSGVKTYSNLGTNLANGQCNADSNKCLGGDDGAGFGWRNMTALKVGVQWKPNAYWILRMGYNFNNQIVRKSDIAVNVLAPGAIVQNLFTFGFTHIFNPGSPTRKELTGFLVIIPTQTLSGPNSLAPTQTITIRARGVGGGLAFAWILP